MRGLGLAVLCALAMTAAAAEQADSSGAFTIKGGGKDPVRIIERDGTVRPVAPQDMQLLNRSKFDARDRVQVLPEKPAEPETEIPGPVEASTPAEPEIAAEEEVEKAPAEDPAALRRAAEEEKRKAAEKEAARYANKDYSYGPGTADDVDKTDAVVESKRGSRSTAGNRRGPRNVRVGGEYRVRVNVRD